MHCLPRVDSMAPNVGHAGINEVLPLYRKFVIDSVTYVLHPGKNQTGSGIKLALHHKIVTSLLSKKLTAKYTACLG